MIIKPTQLHSALKWLIAVAAIIFLPVAVALDFYQQDFESLSISDDHALSNDNWLIFYNVYDSGGVFQFGFGPFPAPNSSACCTGFSAIETGEAGAEQESQYLKSHSDTAIQAAQDDFIETELFQRQNIVAADFGTTWRFEYDAKLPATLPLGPDADVDTFIRTFDPGNGFLQTVIIRKDSTSLSSTEWTTHSIDFTVDDPALIGQELQFGMSNRTVDNQNVSVYYDNIRFYQAGFNIPALPVPALLALTLLLLTTAHKRHIKTGP